jgi:hypothetical protein
VVAGHRLLEWVWLLYYDNDGFAILCTNYGGRSFITTMGNGTFSDAQPRPKSGLRLASGVGFLTMITTLSRSLCLSLSVISNRAASFGGVNQPGGIVLPSRQVSADLKLPLQKQWHGTFTDVSERLIITSLGKAEWLLQTSITTATWIFPWPMTFPAIVVQEHHNGTYRSRQNVGSGLQRW